MGASLLASGCFGLALVALAIGWSELAVVSPRLRVDSGPHTVTAVAGEWETGLTRLYRARHMSPWSAQYRLDLGRYHSSIAWSRPTEPSSAVHQQLAQAYFADALARRPSWGYAWAHWLAGMGTTPGYPSPALGHRLSTGITHGLRLAPMEPVTRRELLRVAWSHWSVLSLSARAEVISRVGEVMRREPEASRELIELAYRLNWEAELQSLLQTPVQRAQAQTLSRAP